MLVRKFLTFSLTSTLALILLLTLTSTWVLSLRPVRLKIGDYYFKQGKFDHAFNWYEKVVRKEKLKTNQDKSDRIEYEEDLSKLKSVLRQQGDFYFSRGNFDQATIWYGRLLREHEFKSAENRVGRLEYEEDLSKLKSALIPVLEGKLTTISQLLGFRQIKDIETLLTDSKSILKDVNELVDTAAKEKLERVEEELKYFNTLENYGDSLSNEPKTKELNYYIMMSHLLRGIIDETKNDFRSAGLDYKKAGDYAPSISTHLNKRQEKVSADECFFQSPLNWIKATELYGSLVRTDDANIGFFLRLAYIHAKFNNFTDSYNYFKKAYELLKDNDLKKTVDLFKGKETLIYPDNLRLVPQKLREKYPLIQDISFFEIKNLFNILGIKVIAKSDGFIGKTGIKSPVNIIIRSAGFLVGNYSQILINGENFSQNRRGYNVVVLNSKTGEIENSESFDTSGSKDHVKKMIDFINGIAKGKIVCVAVLDEASNALSKEDAEIFKKIGAKENLYGKRRWAHGIIGVKGSGSGDAIEVMSEKPIEIYVLNKGG